MASTTDQYPQDGIQFFRRALLVLGIMLALFAFAILYAALLAGGVIAAGAIFYPDLPDEDDAYDTARQREVDAETEAQMAEEKRRASGLSIEQLSIQDAHAEGQRAGGKGTAAGLNPNQCGSPEYEAWERGRRAAEGARLARVA